MGVAMPMPDFTTWRNMVDAQRQPRPQNLPPMPAVRPRPADYTPSPFAQQRPPMPLPNQPSTFPQQAPGSYYDATANNRGRGGMPLSSGNSFGGLGQAGRGRFENSAPPTLQPTTGRPIPSNYSNMQAYMAALSAWREGRGTTPPPITPPPPPAPVPGLQGGTPTGLGSTPGFPGFPKYTSDWWFQRNPNLFGQY